MDPVGVPPPPAGAGVPSVSGIDTSPPPAGAGVPSVSGIDTSPPPTVLGKYQLGRLLGRGSFAKVFLAKSLKSDDAAPVAIKIIDKLKIDPEMAPRIEREVIAMRRLNHPNILRIHEVLATKTKIYLVMELARGGDLFSKLARRPGHRFPERIARHYFHQIVSALHFCHQHGVAHRDVKPQNILLDEEGNVKVSDFGLSAVATECAASALILQTACGTPAFAAPEVVSRRGYDGAKADAWSCGVILYAMLVGGLPFDDGNLVAMYRKMQRREFHFPSFLTRSAKALISSLLDPNPKSRLSIEQIIKDSWFKTSQFGSRSMSLGDLVSLNERKFERVSSMNAFDIIGMSSGLDLSGFFGEGAGIKEKRFTTNEPAAAVVEKVAEVGRSLGYEIEKGKGGKIWLGKGSLLLIVEVLEMTKEMLVVEVKVVDGADSGGGGKMEQVQWGELKSGLGDIVAFWHNEQT